MAKLEGLTRYSSNDVQYPYGTLLNNTRAMTSILIEQIKHIQGNPKASDYFSNNDTLDPHHNHKKATLRS